ncbi:hypothetical protein WKI71_36495 [Streptomyces sp. MS1.AVA.1]|uniref:Tape measure protein n=1 Tax=Streptomyces machairae TaxID=3134109 RepID=A0ABU8UTE6_9ACTN
MLTGLTVVAGGGALALDDLKKKAKELKKPFEEWQKVANKAVAPHTEKAVKSLKSAMDDLNPVIKTGADTFGRITEKAARFVDSPAFQSAFAKNAEMGSRWVEQFAGSIGDFTMAFLDFGTKSQPALDAWQGLLGGFLDRGLPGMFKGLEQGIGGSSEFLDGLAYVINDSLLPSLGKIAGSFMEAFGPLLGEMLITAGDLVNGLASTFEGLMEVAEPVGRILADAWHATVDVLKIGAEVAGSFAKNVGGALLDALLSVAGVDTSGMAGGFTKLSDWVSANENMIRTAFYDIAGSITDMVITGLTWMPQLYDGFKGVITGILEAADYMISGLAAMFEGVPIVGDTFKEWNENFDSFAEGARGNLDSIGEGLHSYADEAIPRASRARLKMNVEEAESNLAHIKEQLKDPELTKERRARLTAEKKQAEDALAAAKRNLKDFDGTKATGRILGNATGFMGALGTVNRSKVAPKTGNITANTRPFFGALGGIAGRVVGTSYINVLYRKAGNALGGGAAGALFKADGGLVDYFAEGGVRGESHVAQIAPAGSWRVWGEPETGGEAYIPLAPAKRPRSREVAEEAVSRLGGDVQWFAKGGVTKAEAQARKNATGDLTLSYYGRMAGYKNTEFAGALGRPDGVGDLVNSLNKWRSVIKSTTHGVQESRLLKQLAVAGKALLKWETNLTKITKSLESAKTKLDGLKDAAASLKSGVRSGIIGSTNITRAAQGDGPVTVASIMGGMRQSHDKASAFSKALKDLKGKGLDKGLIQEIAQAGIEGGGLETAGALLRASSSEISSLNQFRIGIVKSADSAGTTAADAMYGAGIRAAEGLVKGLESQKKSLEKSMLDLAKFMEKSIKKALGIKSPSKVMEQVGDFTAQGFADGIRKNRAIQQAWASMLNTPQGGMSHAQGRGAVVGAGGKGEPLVIELRSSGSEIDEMLLKILRKAINVRGGNAQVVLTGRSG